MYSISAILPKWVGCAYIFCFYGVGMEERKKNIVSWSGGKDSTATVILAHEHGIPIDEIVMAVLWFDKERGIPAILPPHWEFITKVAKPKFEEWGYKVTFVDGKYDYWAWFHRTIKNSPKKPERNGKKYGFLIAGLCGMTSAKQWALREIKKRYSGDEYVSLQGIAIDETERLNRLHKRGDAISLLENYCMAEEEAKDLCANYGLLSPIYSIPAIKRDGCWFCPNSRLAQQAYCKVNFPELWNELQKLSQEDNLSDPYFSRNKTFAEIDEQVDNYIHRPKQCSLFDLFDTQTTGTYENLG